MSRLSLNQATIKYADLATALRVTRVAGIAAIGLWREPVAEIGLAKAAAIVADSGLRVSSLYRGGFVTTAGPADLRAALDENRHTIEETATLAAAGAPGSAPMLVLVAGGLPQGDRDLPGVAPAQPTASAPSSTTPPQPGCSWPSSRCTRSTPPTAA